MAPLTKTRARSTGRQGTKAYRGGGPGGTERSKVIQLLKPSSEKNTSQGISRACNSDCLANEGKNVLYLLDPAREPNPNSLLVRCALSQSSGNRASAETIASLERLALEVDPTTHSANDINFIVEIADALAGDADFENEEFELEMEI